ncbi:MAG: hypoxanthine phosphoribosyltransferase [Elusimicrobiota bacterium]|jgi:hypoxanthine phosphoribosyltransferase
MIETRQTHPDIERILISEEQLRNRIREMGKELSKEYEGRNPVMIGILKGSVMFLADLLREITFECQVDFVSLASYAGASSTGVVRTLLDLRESAQGRDLIVIEDIVDSGLTLSYLLQNLGTRQPRSLTVCTLLDKPECRKAPVQPKYVGFRIPNEFVVGFGLDYNERYRQLPYIGVMKRSAL